MALRQVIGGAYPPSQQTPKISSLTLCKVFNQDLNLSFQKSSSDTLTTSTPFERFISSIIFAHLEAQSIIEYMLNYPYRYRGKAHHRGMSDKYTYTIGSIWVWSSLSRQSHTILAREPIARQLPSEQNEQTKQFY